jgi:hypothetical protein
MCASFVSYLLKCESAIKTLDAVRTPLHLMQ